MSTLPVRTYSPLNRETFGMEVARGYEVFQTMEAVMQDVDMAGVTLSREDVLITEILQRIELLSQIFPEPSTVSTPA